MAKSLRSKHRRKMRAIKREKNLVKEKVMLNNMLEAAKKNQDVEMKTAKEIKEDAMDTTTKSEYSSKRMLNEKGNYPKWMNQRKISQVKAKNARRKKKPQKVDVKAKRT
eukprot:TRINITY_DN22665_c0_g1_i1.p1 TRINITY_DN22665_c0_g1~~TRINITY_DN22665_c0_g1_i1.p1  ORF type:complete len:109 (-),score=31.32 TRINITY_DN22665_c0_g1_i1:108-434(-)